MKRGSKRRGGLSGIERRLLYLITERFLTARICKMGNRFYIQLPKSDNVLWRRNVELRIYLKWSWDVEEGDEE